MGAATLCEPLTDDPEDPNVVKVVRSRSGRAIYFSRAPIPFPREGDAQMWRRHVGVYGFRVGTLKTFVALPQSDLEHIERLEQLRLLDNDIDMLVLDACASVPGGVDTPADLERINALFD